MPENPYTLHGTGLHNELDALKKAGLTNGEIINAAIKWCDGN
ncbi:hypothetical protein ACOBV9_19455 (plasmid) [Pseudoalteromonas espejiana]